ncbi:MAG TPA: glutamine--fructose-6-phosphate aminotransferase, partial [Flavobacteriales bacterium]|nr:glutamine--fructose-6-phosphate aminotransferase [Flavobacteriales bacterium]
MCGIVGYTGSKDAYPILIKGLQRLEYRGYDSAGVALMNDKTTLHKCKGKVVDLQNHIGSGLTTGTAGIGHTRWATHGEPNDVNAHPHTSMSGDIVLIHNGIIENYDSVRKELIHRGYTFHSETDTEVLVNLIEEIKKSEACSLSEAIRKALNEVIGAYAIVVMSNSEPGTLVAAK